jgi:hypothetical protein
MPQVKSITDQLAEVLGQHLDGPLSEIEQGIHQLKEGLSSSLESLRGQLAREARVQLQGTLAEAASAIADRAAASIKAQCENRFKNLSAACRRILSSRTQAEILTGLSEGAAHFSSRAVLFLSKGNYLVAWETRGLTNQETISGIRATQIPKQSETVLAKACSELRPLEGDAGSHRENVQLLERLGGEKPDRILCFPVVIHGKAAAVLYTDQIPHFSNQLNFEALSLLVEMSQMRIELHSLETRLGIKPTRMPVQVPEPVATATMPEQSVAAPITPEPPAPVVFTPEPPAPVVLSPASSEAGAFSEQVPAAILEPTIEPVRIIPKVEPAPPAPEMETTALLISPLIGMPDSIPIPEPPPKTFFAESPEFEATTRLEIQDLPHFGAVAQEAPPSSPAPPSGPIWQAAPEAETPPAVAPKTDPDEGVEIDLDTIFSTGSTAPPAPPAKSPAVISTPLGPTDRIPSADDTHRFITVPSELAKAHASSLQAQPRPAESDATPAAPELERLHNEAKRFARLLASEIKLYNEQAVNEGRRQRDIYDRLKKDIDRSRQLYNQRVSKQVACRIDYFHDELVRILGANDPTTLGSDYPGPRLAEDE